MARIRLYTNSVLANIVNVFGYLFAFIGVMTLLDGEIAGGIIILGIGIALVIWAASISENKKFTNWKKDI